MEFSKSLISLEHALRSFIIAANNLKTAHVNQPSKMENNFYKEFNELSGQAFKGFERRTKAMYLISDPQFPTRKARTELQGHRNREAQRTFEILDRAMALREKYISFLGHTEFMDIYIERFCSIHKLSPSTHFTSRPSS